MRLTVSPYIVMKNQAKLSVSRIFYVVVLFISMIINFVYFVGKGSPATFSQVNVSTEAQIFQLTLVGVT